MEPFTTHTGTIAVVPGDNVDTDRIIPARYLTKVDRAGYGELLFKDVRGPEFALDQPSAAGASILIVGSNFGCGSSREHAVWAIQQAGYRAVIARKSATTPGYSDIFRGNAGNCGLALIELEAADHEKLVAAGSGAEASIDLPNQTVTLGNETFGFDMNEMTKDSLVAGLDLIGTTLRYAEAITEFEAKSLSFVPVAV